MKLTPQKRAHGLLALTLLGGGVLFSFSPQQYHFYPLCPFHFFTHLLCPGCGGTRAVAELLHLHFAAAFHLNAVVTLLAPVVLAGFLYWYGKVVTHRKPSQLHFSRGALVVMGIVTVLFTIVRNLPIGFTI
jgi:hypothetical protein